MAEILSHYRAQPQGSSSRERTKQFGRTGTYLERWNWALGGDSCMRGRRRKGNGGE